MNWQVYLLVPEKSSALKLNNFDAVRLAMAMLVVWSHSFALWWGSEQSEPLSRLTLGAYNSGNVAVLAFFTISGFLITLSCRRASSPSIFLARRVARIYPGYIVATLVCSLVVVPAFSSRAFGELRPDEIGGIASNLLLRNFIVTSNAFHGGAVNGSLWSIPYEFWCYIGVLSLGLVGMLQRRWLYPAIAIAVMLARVWLDMTGRRPSGGFIETIIGFPYFWFNVLPPFVLGGAVLVWRRVIPRSAWLAAGLVALSVGLAHLPLAEPLPAVLSRLALPPALAYLVFFIVFSERVHLHDVARFGDFSYGAYLYAFPIQQMLVASLKGRISFAAFILLSLLGSFAAGALSWALIERWFLRRVRRTDAPLQEEVAIVAPSSQRLNDA